MSNFPGTIDSFNVITTANYMDEAGYVLHEHLNSHGSAVVAIETNLGTNSGTSVLKNFTAGDFPARMNVGGTLQQVLTGTINNGVFGTPAITGGTWTNPTLPGTLAGVTLGTPFIIGGTADNQTVGTPAITGGTHNTGTFGTPAITGGTFNQGTFGSPSITGGTIVMGGTMVAILDEDTMVTNSDTAVPTQQSVKAYVDSQEGGEGASNMGQQSLINGNFDIWQRGTSIANTTANSYTADMWYVDTATAGDDKTVTRQTSDVVGSFYACRVQRVAGETGNTVLRLSQVLESQDSIKLRGKYLNLSFYAKVGANFSAASNLLTARIVTGTGTDQKLNAFTNSTDVGTLDITGTTASTKYSFSTGSTISGTVTQVGVSVSYDPVGTAGANDWFELSQVQLCIGTVALTFQPRTTGQEMALCKRHFHRFGAETTYSYYSFGLCTSGTSAYVQFPMPVKLRAAPGTLTTSGSLALEGSAAAVLPVTAFLADQLTTQNCSALVKVAAGTPAVLNLGDATQLISNNDANSYIDFSAEI